MKTIILTRRQVIDALREYAQRNGLANDMVRVRATIRKGGCMVTYEEKGPPTEEDFARVRKHLQDWGNALIDPMSMEAACK